MSLHQHARQAARWVSLAAAPSFAAMALLTGSQAGPAADPMCSGGDLMSPLGGMTMMYALMSAAHMAPWLRLFARRRQCAKQYS
jgi:hypothetical protein